MIGTSRRYESYDGTSRVAGVRNPNVDVLLDVLGGLELRALELIKAHG